MSGRVIVTALVCLTVIACLALWLDVATGKEIAAAVVGAIAGGLTTHAAAAPQGASHGGPSD